MDAIPTELFNFTLTLPSPYRVKARERGHFLLFVYVERAPLSSSRREGQGLPAGRQG